MRKSSWLVAALAVVMVPVAARAQGGGVYVEGHRTWISGSTLGGDSLSGPSGNATGIGATFGTFYDFYHLGPINLGGDARFSFSRQLGESRYGNGLNYGGANVRLSGVLPKFPVRPYVQGGVIEVGTNYAYHSSMRGGLGAGYGVGADVDFAPHVAVRVEYSGGHMGDLKAATGGTASLNFNQIQGGLVIWFGRD